MKNISKIQYITQSKTEASILAEVKEVLEAGIDWVQLRVKDESLDYLSIAKKVQVLTKEFKATFIINDRVDIAKEINADGVHVGLEDMPITEAREVLGKDKIIGGTANTFADAKNIELFDGDYIGLGPFRETKTKKKLSPVLGLKSYAEIVPKKEPYGWQFLVFNIPILAIGGIEVEDVKQLQEKTGVHGVALSGLIYKSNNKKELIEELKNILG
jgi:thiamine-phosphate pyrophosphorylase